MAAPADIAPVELDERAAAYLRAGQGVGAVIGPAVVAGLFFGVGSLLSPPLSFVVSAVGIVVGAAIAAVVLRRRLDGTRRRGLRIEGPLSVVRTELDPVGSLPARTIWGLQAPGLGRGVEVVDDAAAELDPEGTARLAARRNEGAWPGGSTVRTELPGRGTLLVGRRSRVLLRVELDGGTRWEHPDVPAATGPGRRRLRRGGA